MVLRLAPEVLDVPPSALELNRRAIALLIEKLQPSGIETVDLLQDFAASGEQCFWHADHHLSQLGHRRVADALETILAPQVAELKASRTR